MSESKVQRNCTVDNYVTFIVNSSRGKSGDIIRFFRNESKFYEGAVPPESVPAKPGIVGCSNGDYYRIEIDTAEADLDHETYFQYIHHDNVPDTVTVTIGEK